jgi:hypothetical protein
VRRAVESEFKLYGFLFYSLDVEPEEYNDSFETMIRITTEKGSNDTEYKPGHYPIWSHLIERRIN